MSALDAALVAWAARDERAQRRTNYCHRRLAENPMMIVPWQLGGEPFALAAVGYGDSPDEFDLSVAGQPLNRDLAFAALEPVAAWFNETFEQPWDDREAVTRGKQRPRTVLLAPRASSVMVPNPGAVKLLGRLGRRLAYLPVVPSDDGPPPAPPALVRFGRHLQFLARHYPFPGQQILVDAVTLCNENWITMQSALERQNLGAIDAWIEQPPGASGYKAATKAESLSVGPIPNPDDERDIAKWMDDFDAALKDGKPKHADLALARIEERYEELTGPAWAITWRVLRRERRWPEEPRYVGRRAQADTEAYSQHMAWLTGPAAGRRRTRETVRQALRSRADAETAASLVEAEEATSDLLRMIPYLLDHKAVEGAVVRYVDRSEVKPGNQRPSSVPRVTIRTEFGSLVPRGKELWWAEDPGRVRGIVEDVTSAQKGMGSLVTLKIVDGARASDGLRRAATACFSTLTTKTYGYEQLPAEDPFTHRLPGADTVDHIEPEGEA